GSDPERMSDTAVLPSRTARLKAAIGVYLERRVLIILLLGFSSGLPLALSGSTLAIWMADRGVDLHAIGLFSLAGLPYTIKFIWAPVVDAWRVPLLSRLFGRRRGWLVLSQLLLIDRKSTRLNSSHVKISYSVFCLKKKKK